MFSYALRVFTAFILLSFGIHAKAAEQIIEEGKLYRGEDLREVELEQVLNQAQLGQIFMVAELHGQEATHELQRTLIKGLAIRGFKVSVGIEHFSHLEQQVLDAYLKNQLTEQDLLRTVKLSGFESWREQLWLPLWTGGWSYGINAPRWLTGKINAVGYELLSPLEKQILPPDFRIGGPTYKARMLEIMGMIHPTASFDKMFEAQSAWDATSAWQLVQLTQQHPDNIFVVLFGDFHVAYGGGVEDQLRQRGFTNVVSFSQICIDGLSQNQLRAELGPSPRFGRRANYVRGVKCSSN